MPKRLLKGEVVSAKTNCTVVVRVTSLKSHPKYKKITKLTKKYKAHWVGEPLSAGDTVLIEESKPISKDKHWTVKSLVRRRNLVEGGEAVEDRTLADK